MIVALEGIDGSGKTTLAEALRRKLLAKGLDARVVRKSLADLGNLTAGEEWHLRDLQGLIWKPPEVEFGTDLLGTHHHLYLLAAWFSAVQQKLIRNIPDGQIILLDGWWYRVAIKSHLRGGLGMDWVCGLFSHVSEPSHTILLDVEPSTAWQRRQTFKPSELGRWDGFEGDPRHSYCQYQARIRELLLAFAAQRGWSVVRQSAPLDADQVLSEAEGILSRLAKPELSANELRVRNSSEGVFFAAADK